MKKIMLFVIFLGTLETVSGQDVLPVKPFRHFIRIDSSTVIRKSDITNSSKTYTEIYEVITDSLVRRFGMVFSTDSSFIRIVPMENIDRKFYDQMQTTTNEVLSSQEKMRKETVDFINSYRTSYEVWSLFKAYKILK